MPWNVAGRPPTESAAVVPVPSARAQWWVTTAGLGSDPTAKTWIVPPAPLPPGTVVVVGSVIDASCTLLDGAVTAMVSSNSWAPAGGERVVPS